MVRVDERFRCGDDVIAKVMDGEAVIINLATGAYYGTDPIGGAVWSLLEGGYSVREIAARLANAFGVPAPQVAADMARFVAQLLEEGILVAGGGADHGSIASDTDVVLPDTYAPPALNAYRDMQDLLALDPPMPGFGDTPWRDQGGGSEQ